MGFWRGFAQGWEAESERIERRKLFQQELNEKRVGTLAELATRMGRRTTNGPGGTGDDATPNSVDHNLQVLTNYGVDPDTISTVAAKGGHALQAMVDTIKETAKNPAALNPATFSSIAESIVVTTSANEPIDPKAIAESIYGAEYAESMSPEDLNYIAAMGGGNQPSVEVSVPYIAPEPFDVAKAGQIITAANQTLRGTVAQERALIEDQLSSLPADAAERQGLSERAAQLDIAIAELDEDNPVGAIQILGQEKAYQIIEPYLVQDPELANAPTGLLGIWGTVIKPTVAIGTVMDGFRFKGGDPADENNWEPV